MISRDPEAPLTLAICQTNHYTSHKPQHQSQTTTQDEANIRIHAILLKPLRGPTSSVLASQCFAWP